MFYNQPAILRNTGWNVFGMFVPIAVALVAIPLIISTLGHTRFGLLSIGWVVLGYFALFDLGLGRATTKFTADFRSTDSYDTDRLTKVIWTSIYMHGVLGALSCLVLAALTPWLVKSGFKIPPELQQTTIEVFYWLAASLPFIIVASCLRGILEAYNRFDAVNKVKVGSSVINYAAPLMVLPWTHNLILVVAIICCSRVLVLMALAAYCLRELPDLRYPRDVSRAQLFPLLRFGGWVTVSSLIAPVIMITDRIFIAGIFQIGAVTYYVVPYEIVTKLWIFSASLMGAMFPLMSALGANRGELWRLMEQSERYLFTAAVPIVGFLLVFSRELLLLWIGSDFSVQSTAIAKWLAVGVLVNVAAQAPITMVQAANRPDLIAKLQLVQLPPFVAFAWYMVHQFGSVGAAIAWTCRVFVEAMVVRYFASRLTSAPPLTARQRFQALLILFFLSCCWAIDSLWRHTEISKLLFFLPLLLLFCAWAWYQLLTAIERQYIAGFVARSVRHEP